MVVVAPGAGVVVVVVAPGGGVGGAFGFGTVAGIHVKENLKGIQSRWFTFGLSGN